MKKAALYTRVSTNYQIDKDSLPYQRKELINYAKYSLNITEYEVFEDAGFSGKNTDRPAYQEMMAKIRNGEFTHIVVNKIDRISRNLLDFAAMYDELKSLGVVFVSRNEQFDTSSAMGEAMLKIILVFAELERHMTSERVTAVMLSRAKQGKWNGANVPWGYDWSVEKKYPVINESEAKIIKYIFDIYESGMSTKKIARLLNNENIRGKRNGPIIPTTIRQILHNPFYIGTYRYNYRSSARGKIKNPDEWIVIENNHPGIISKEQFEKVQKIAEERFNKTPLGKCTYYYQHHQQIHYHIFAGMLKCRCGSSGGAKVDRPRKNGFAPSNYRCLKNRDCGPTVCDNNTNISDVTIGPFVFDYLQNMLSIQKNIKKYNTKEKIEKRLLEGKPFKLIKGIEKTSLDEIFKSYMIKATVKYETPKQIQLENQDPRKDLLNERQINERALARLKNLFLYGENGISEKDYILEKKSLTEKILEIDKKLSNIASKATEKIIDKEFFSEVDNFLIQKQLMSEDAVNWQEFSTLVDHINLQQFLRRIIRKITYYRHQILSIEFSNGIEHRFIYD